MPIEKTLLSKDQLKLTIDWGELSGDIHNQYDLINIINNKVDIDHTHDEAGYTPIDAKVNNTLKLGGKPASYYTTAFNINYDNTTSNITATNIQSAFNLIMDILMPKIFIPEIIKSTSGTLTVDELKNTVINNYGQTDTIDLILPPADNGLRALVIIGEESANHFRLLPATGDIIYMNNSTYTTSETQGVGILTPVIGSALMLMSFQSDTVGDYNWLATPKSGDWSIF
jgi:hypothetical protein